jgi:hypothetical protein
VQEIYQNNDQVFIICILKDQAELLHTLPSVEIDMSYKRVQSKELKELVFAAYLNNQKKSIYHYFIILVSNHLLTTYDSYYSMSGLYN